MIFSRLINIFLVIFFFGLLCLIPLTTNCVTWTVVLYTISAPSYRRRSNNLPSMLDNFAKPEMVCIRQTLIMFAALYLNYYCDHIISCYFLLHYDSNFFTISKFIAQTIFISAYSLKNRSYYNQCNQ